MKNTASPQCLPAFLLSRFLVPPVNLYLQILVVEKFYMVSVQYPAPQRTILKPDPLLTKNISTSANTFLLHYHAVHYLAFHLIYEASMVYTIQ